MIQKAEEAMSDTPVSGIEIRRLGILAGNGQLPFEALKEALSAGLPVTVAAIKEEAEPALEKLARSAGDRVNFHWIGVGQLGRLLKVFHIDAVDCAIMVGQVKHVRIFAPSSRSPLDHLRHLPDLKMVRMLASLERRNTESLIRGVIEAVESEGIRFLDSTLFLRRLLPAPGPITRRTPNREEQKDLDFGRPLALEIARLDIGQTIVVKNQAVVAVEAMEGTDETIRRAARLVQGQRLTVIKVSRPAQDMRFDVPVIGPHTVRVLREANVSAMALDAGRTIVLEKEKVIEQLNHGGISVVAF